MSELFRMILSNGIFIMLGLFAGSAVIQKHIVTFPNELLPLFNGVLGTILSTLWFTLHYPHIPIFISMLVGFLFGLAATGLHQLITKTKRYYVLRKFTKTRELRRKTK